MTNNTKKSFHIATIHDKTTNSYEVEVDGQMIAQFNNEADALSHAELLAFVFDVGYETRDRDYETITEEDTYFPFEMPDSFTFNNNFAGNN